MDAYTVKCAVYTALRANWPVKKLQLMSGYGEDTPVSGDALVQSKSDLAKAQR